MMCKSTICFLVLCLAGVRGRYAFRDGAISDITNNVLDEVLKFNATDIHIELPTFKPHTDVAAETTTENSESSTNPVTVPNQDNVGRDIKENTINDEDSKENEVLPEEDSGVTLKLTPFIKENHLEEARNASRVTEQEIFLGVESYTGYFTVNETDDSHLFFWYFPVEKKPVNETPWIIWLQGGPGASSMTGLFDEIGPFKVTPDRRLIRNEFTWLTHHSLLFIDSPVGTGFSYTNSLDGFVKDMDTYGLHLYSAVKQFLQVFPELRDAPLYIAGESYAGKYVPALAINIHRNIDEEPINMQGLITGNAYVDPGMISRMDRAFYNYGMIDQEQLEMLQPLLDAFKKDIDTNNSTAAKFRWNKVINALLVVSYQSHGYNVLRDNMGAGGYVGFLKQPMVQKAIHTGGILYNYVNVTVNVMLREEFLTSAKWIYEELLPHYRVLTYCGHLDLMLSCVATSENYRTWRWNGTEEFKQATRHAFIYKNKLAGYYKTGGHLTSAVVLGAGHMAPMDAPGPTRNLVTSFTHQQQLFSPPANTDYLQQYIHNSTRSEHLSYL